MFSINSKSRKKEKKIVPLITTMQKGWEKLFIPMVAKRNSHAGLKSYFFIQLAKSNELTEVLKNLLHLPTSEFNFG